VATEEQERIATEAHKDVELKKKKEEEERSGMSTPEKPKSIILTSPLNPGTPLNVISSNFSYSSLKDVRI
jgi:hypothetical protein